MVKKEFEQLNKLTDLELAKLPMDKWRDYYAYKFKDNKRLKHIFKPLKKRAMPDIPQCVKIYNMFPKARDGMRKILLNYWGLGDQDTLDWENSRRLTANK